MIFGKKTLIGPAYRLRTRTASYPYGPNTWPELLRYCQFQKFFIKIFCFHRKKYKRQIKYRPEPLFFKTDFKSSSLIFRCVCLPPILHFVLYLQNTKGKLIFRKIENMQLFCFF